MGCTTEEIVVRFSVWATDISLFHSVTTDSAPPKQSIQGHWLCSIHGLSCRRVKLISRNNSVSRLSMSGAFPPFLHLHGTHWDEFTLCV